jgi:hypothetical protein
LLQTLGTDKKKKRRFWPSFVGPIFIDAYHSQFSELSNNKKNAKNISGKVIQDAKNLVRRMFCFLRTGFSGFRGESPVNPTSVGRTRNCVVFACENPFTHKKIPAVALDESTQWTRYYDFLCVNLQLIFYTDTFISFKY